MVSISLSFALSNIWLVYATEFMLSHFEERVFFQFVLGGFASIQTKLNQISYFYLFGVFLASNIPIS